MFSLSECRPAARLALVLPLLALASCGGNKTGAIITVPNSVVAADLNGDGFTDVAVVGAQIDQTGLDQKPGLLGVFINLKATPGTFAAGVNYATSGSPPSGLAVGDLSGTGSHDMVVANFNAGTLSVLKETSPTSGTYGAATPINIGGHPNDVQIADINGDGIPDLIVADDLGKVTYMLQSSTGTFGTPVSLPITNRGIAVATGDLNGDGLVDLAVTSFDVNGDFGMVTIYFQDPSHPGTFLTPATTITTYAEPSQIKIVDINADGAKDIVIAAQGAGLGANLLADPSTQAYAEGSYGAMVILQNVNAPGTFAAPLTYPSAVGVISLAVADLDGDGLLDIAMASPSPQGQGTIATAIQDPAHPGTFLIPTTYSGFGQPVSIVIADVDHDGLPDLVTADGIGAVWYKNVTAKPGTFVIQTQLGTLQ